MTHSTPKAAVRSKYLRLATVADQYGISVKTLRRRISDGTIPGYKVGGQLRVREDDLDRLVRRIPARVPV